jgi:branched-chain amino acid transport system substrate-binding protein
MSERLTDAARRILSCMEAREQAVDGWIGLPVDDGPHSVELFVAAALALHEHKITSGMSIGVKSIDDRKDPATAAAAARSFAAEGIPIVVGHFSASAALAAAPVYENAGIPFLAPATTHPDLTNQRFGFVFRVCGRDERQAALIASSISENYNGLPVLIVGQASAYGLSLSKYICDALFALGQRAEAVIVRSAEDVPYGVLSRSEVVAVAGAQHFAASLILRHQKLGGRAPFFVGDDAISFWFVSAMSGTPVRVYAPAMLIDRAGTARLSDEAERHLGITKAEFEAVASGAYFTTSFVATSIAARALECCRAGQANSAANFLRNSSCSTPLGDFTFDAAGDIDRLRWAMRHLNGNGFVP